MDVAVRWTLTSTVDSVRSMTSISPQVEEVEARRSLTSPEAMEEEANPDRPPEDLTQYTEWALEKAGGAGLFQYKYLVLLGAPWIYWGMQTYAPMFFSSSPQFKIDCADPIDDFFLCGTIGQADSGKGSSSRFPGNITQSVCKLPEGVTYTYTDESVTSSLLSSFGKADLICEGAYLVPLLTTFFFLGFASGLPVGGRWADMRGRKEAYLGGLVILAVPGVMQAVATGYWMYAAARFLFGFAFAIVNMTVFVWSSEFLGRESRGTIVWSANCMFALGQILISPVAYWFRKWRTLAWVVFAVGCSFFTYAWSLQESPKWLASKERYAAAHKVLCEVARVNGNPPPPPPPGSTAGSAEVDVAQDGAKASVFLLCDRRLLTRFLVACLSWFTVSFGFYGLSLNAGNLPLDIYLANAINGFVQIPAYIAAAKLMEAPVCGRRKACMLGFLCAGLCLLLCTIIPSETALMVLCYTGNFCISIAFGTVFLYAAELFPTSIRGQGLSITSMFARIGAMVSPFVAALGAASPALPLLIFGVPCLVVGALQVFLPETRGAILPDTIDDIKPLGEGKGDAPNGEESTAVGGGQSDSTSSFSSESSMSPRRCL